MDKVIRFLRTAATVRGGLYLYIGLVAVGVLFAPYAAVCAAVGAYFLGRRGEVNDHV